MRKARKVFENKRTSSDAVISNAQRVLTAKMVLKRGEKVCNVEVTNSYGKSDATLLCHLLKFIDPAKWMQGFYSDCSFKTISSELKNKIRTPRIKGRAVI